MNRKQAKELDAILNVFTPTCWKATASCEEMPNCYKLEELGMIEVLSRDSRTYGSRKKELNLGRKEGLQPNGTTTT